MNIFMQKLDSIIVKLNLKLIEPRRYVKSKYNLQALRFRVIGLGSFFSDWRFEGKKRDLCLSECPGRPSPKARGFTKRTKSENSSQKQYSIHHPIPYWFFLLTNISFYSMSTFDIFGKSVICSILYLKHQVNTEILRFLYAYNNRWK